MTTYIEKITQSFIHSAPGQAEVSTRKMDRCEHHCVCAYICLSESESCSVVSNSLQPHGLYSPWNSPGQNTRVGSLFLPQGIFPTQGSNRGLPHCRQILYQLSHKGSPRMGSLSLRQWIFPTRESNWALLHCRRILSQLSYHRSSWER